MRIHAIPMNHRIAHIRPVVRHHNRIPPRVEVWVIVVIVPAAPAVTAAVVVAISSSCALTALFEVSAKTLSVAPATATAASHCAEFAFIVSTAGFFVVVF